jgi:hypothetical protein
MLVRHRRDMTHLRHVPRSLLLTAGAILALAGCQSVPIPVTIDLLEHLGDAASGTIEEAVLPGAVSDLRVDLPERGALCVDVSDAVGRIIVSQATLSYEFVARYDGPPISGTLILQPYLAGDASALFTPAARAGDPLRLELGASEVRTGGTIRLSGAQRRALNDGLVCWSLRLDGDVAADEAGRARIDYEITELRLRAGVALF